MYRSSNIIEERKDFGKTSRDSFLINALYDAVADGDVTTVGFLLQHKKVDPNCLLEEYDAAPLHTATGIGTEELALQLVQLLLTYGANPNLQTSDGTTPLIIACIFGRTSIASLLFKYGGNPLVEDSEGMNAIEYAYENGFLIMQDVFNNRNWSILESSDGSVVDKGNLTKRFISIFNDNISVRSDYSQLNKVEFSDIESGVSCAEFGTFNNAFLESANSSYSSTGTFFSTVDNKDAPINIYGNIHTDSFKISDTSYDLSALNSSDTASKNSCSQLSCISYRTDRIKYELKRHNVNHGPITSSTKQVYYNLIKKVIKGKKKGPFDVGEFSNYPEVLRSTLESKVQQLILKWTNLEEQLSKNFSDGTKEWRGGREKQFFTYLLLDPFVTNNLSSKKNISVDEIWKTFLLSIFYIGKGKNSRPFSHLYEALKNNLKKTVNKKVYRIQTIWEKSAGVICLHIFHNVICAEAHTREAAMIDAIGLSNLTNIQSGEYYGIVKNWSLKQKQQLGIVLLNKALQIYLAEGERQIFPTDLKSGK